MAVPKILVSNSNELLRHLAAEPFHGMDIDLRVATSGDEAIAMSERETPDLVMVQAELPGASGYEVARRIKAMAPGCGVILVLEQRITSEQMKRVTECGCDEVLVAPMSADELYDVIAVLLGMPRHGGKPFVIDIAEITPEGPRPLSAQVSNQPEPVGKG
jgi:DNA-binding response OmpR family regulator